MDSLKLFAIIFGLLFIAMGVLGYMPSYVIDNKIFGYFEVDNMHNIFHLSCGVLALLAAVSSSLSRLYFEVIGIVFAIIAIAGLIFGGDLYFMHANIPDSILNLFIAVIALYIGFIHKADL